MARNSFIAIVLLVILRLAIGWQLLYEGLWKLDTLDTPRPWTAAGYLKNAEGPMRDTFRGMAGDPDELDWLNYDVVAARWDNWAKRFEDNYGLSKKQSERLGKLLNGAHGSLDGRPVYASNPLEKLPETIENLNKDSRVSDSIVWYDPDRKMLYVDGKRHMTDAEKDRLLALVNDGEDDDSKAFRKAVEEVFARQKRGIGYKEKLAGAVKGNPDLVGNEQWQRVGEKQEYTGQLARYEQQRAVAATDFQWDHLNYDWGKMQSLRGRITAPVKALEQEFQDAATKLLTLEQMQQKPQRRAASMLLFIDWSTMIGLTVLGALLIFGLFTRCAAFGAACLLFSFYLAMPPLPGVPELPGPEHSFIINKNLIEVIALLAIAALPTGRWFGVDAWFAGWRARSKKEAVAA